MIRKLRYVLFALLLLGSGASLLIGSYLVAPQMRPVELLVDGPSFESVNIARADGNKVAGWFFRGEFDAPGILLLHSVRSNRQQMVGRARFLIEAGYSVLLIDMQAHGETPGENITFGYRESYDAKAAADYLRGRVESQKIAVVGVSLGGAAALLGGSPVKADAVILEGVYSTIERAVENRISIRLGIIGRYLAPLLTRQIEPRLGITLEQLSPLRAITQLKAPVMIVAGTNDRHTLIEETRQLFEQAGKPKELWLIDGAEHQDLHVYAGREYEQRVLEFLHKYL